MRIWRKGILEENSELNIRLKERISYYLQKKYISNPGVTFQTYILKRIDELMRNGGFREESEIYKRGNIDRKLHSRIKNSDKEYRPSKKIALAYCIALGLSMGEACNLMWMVGYHFEEDNLTDQIVKFFLKNQIYSADEVNKYICYFAKEYKLENIEYIGSVMYNKSSK